MTVILFICFFHIMRINFFILRTNRRLLLSNKEIEIIVRTASKSLCYWNDESWKSDHDKACKRGSAHFLVQCAPTVGVMYIDGDRLTHANRCRSSYQERTRFLGIDTKRNWRHTANNKPWVAPPRVIFARKFLGAHANNSVARIRLLIVFEIS